MEPHAYRYHENYFSFELTTFANQIFTTQSCLLGLLYIDPSSLVVLVFGNIDSCAEIKNSSYGFHM